MIIVTMQRDIRVSESLVNNVNLIYRPNISDKCALKICELLILEVPKM